MKERWMKSGGQRNVGNTETTEIKLTEKQRAKLKNKVKAKCRTI